MLRKEERPFYWSMVPNHGDHCGPGHESEGPPKSDTDAACMRHDRCYGEAFTREEELLCDAEACNEIAHVVADDLGEHLYKEGMKMAFCNQPYSLAMEDKQMTQAPRQWGQPRRTRRDEHLNVDVEIKEQRVPGRRHISRKQSPDSLLDEFEEEIRVSKTSAPREQFVQADGKKVGPRLPGGQFKAKGKGLSKRAKKNANRKAKAIKRTNKKANKGYRQGIKKRLKRAGVRPTVGVSEFAHKVEQQWDIQPMRGKGRKSDGIILTGSDLLDVVKTEGTAPPVGAVTFKIPLAPSDTAWATTRLAQFVPLFQRYKFLSVEFVWEPACGTNTGGQGIHFIDYDVDVGELITPIEDTLSSVKVAAAKKNTKPFRFWNENQTKYVPDGEIQTLFLEPGVAGSDPRLYSQGKYYLVVAVPPPINTSLGIIYVKYRIQLWDASLTIAAPAPPVTPDVFVAQYNFNEQPGGQVLSTDRLGNWLFGESGVVAPTFSNMPDAFQIESSVDGGGEWLWQLNHVPFGVVDVNFGFRMSDKANNHDSLAGPWSSAGAVCAVSDLDTASADWVRLDVDDTVWRSGSYDANNDATPAFYGPTTAGADTAQEMSIHGYVRFNHSGGDTPLFFRTIGVMGTTTSFPNLINGWATTWINVMVVPPPVKKLCPHEVRARPFGKYFASDLYVWHPSDRCKHECSYCEERARKYGTEEERRQHAKEERQAEKAKERDTLSEVMSYLLERTKKADKMEEKTSVNENQKGEYQDPDRAVLDGLVNLPKQQQPKAMLIMASCPCSCGKFECDICGCHELSGCDGGMRIPRPEASALELRMFWNTVLSNLNDDKALCDLAKRQGTYRSIRAFLSLDQNLGKEK